MRFVIANNCTRLQVCILISSFFVPNNTCTKFHPDFSILTQSTACADRRTDSHPVEIRRLFIQIIYVDIALYLSRLLLGKEAFCLMDLQLLQLVSVARTLLWFEIDGHSSWVLFLQVKQICFDQFTADFAGLRTLFLQPHASSSKEILSGDFSPLKYLLLLSYELREYYSPNLNNFIFRMLNDCFLYIVQSACPLILFLFAFLLYFIAFHIIGGYIVP